MPSEIWNGTIAGPNSKVIIYINEAWLQGNILLARIIQKEYLEDHFLWVSGDKIRLEK